MARTSTADLHVAPQKDLESSRRHWSVFDVWGLAGVVVAGVLVLVPALVHGTFIGPYDILQNSGLNQTPGVKVHNATLFDQISLFIPWTNLVWTQVHEGHLPLWNPYSVLGMPLAFNWESAPLSLPVLIGYLFPVRLAYTAQLVVTIAIAGTGVYVLGKVLRLATLGCMTAAIVFELSGYFIGYLGWPLSSVWSWGGWVFAGIVLVLRGGKRIQMIVLLAAVIAFAIYAGNPEGQLLLALAAGIFAVTMLLLRAPALGGSGPVIRPVIDLGLAAVAGLALGAPLILPGLEVGRGSNRTAIGPDLFPRGLPPRELVHLIFQGFDGLPVSGSKWFGLSTYEATCAYVGITVLVLAATAIVLRWRRPEVRSFVLVAGAMGLLVFAPPLVSFLDNSGARIYWIFAATPLSLALAVLSGIGMDVVVKSYREPRVRRVVGIGFGALGVLLGVIWLVGRRGLTPTEADIRSHSFVWPVTEVVVGLAVVWMLSRAAARTRPWHGSSAISAGNVAGSLLLLVTTGFLLASGAPLISSSSDYPTSTPAVATLQRAVGDAVVGLGGAPTFPSTTGIMANANLLYDVHEFTVYDPMTPSTYFSLDKTPISALAAFSDILVPAVTSTQAARLYGISYVLEPSSEPGPKGSVFDRRIGNEDLYRVPGAAGATLVGLRSNGSLPGMYAQGAPVRVDHPNPSTWQMATNRSTDGVLRLRLTNVPGWRATIDGRPVAVSPFARTMLQVRVPPGRHVVVLEYWPKSFSVGIVLALCAAFALAILLVMNWLRSRRSSVSGGRADQSGGGGLALVDTGLDPQ